MRFGLYKYINGDEVVRVDSLWLGGVDTFNGFLDDVPIEITIVDDAIKATVHENDRFDPLINWEKVEEVAAKDAIIMSTFSTTREFIDEDGVLVDWNTQNPEFKIVEAETVIEPQKFIIGDRVKYIGNCEFRQRNPFHIVKNVIFKPNLVFKPNHRHVGKFHISTDQGEWFYENELTLIETANERTLKELIKSEDFDVVF